jgi:ABC-2 type transport system permease protein
VKFLKLGNGVPHYPVYLLLGIVVWNFFVEMTVQSTSSVVGRGDLIRKIRIPRWMVVFSTSFSALINLALNLVVVAVFMAINHVEIRNTLLLAAPILLEIYIFALGISFLLAALFVKFRDISYIWEVLLQAGFYATPILYPLSRIPSIAFQKIIMLNPMAQAVQDIRFALITHQTTTIYSLYRNNYLIIVPFIVVVLFLFLGVFYFKMQSKYFAENI